MSYLVAFSPSFRLAASLWPLAALVLTLPILAFLYHRDGRLGVRTVLGCYLTVLYLLSLVCFTLYPLPSGDRGAGVTFGVAPQLDPMGFVADVRDGGARAVFQILANVAFFLPLGIVVGRGLGWGFAQTLALGLLTSLLIETSQLTGLFGAYPYAYRCFDVDDLLWNASGAAIGWLIAAALNRLLPRRRLGEQDICRAPGLVRRGVALTIDMALVMAVYLAATLGLELATQVGGIWVESFDELCTGIWVASFVVVELLVPAAHAGSTPGGGFVRMTCETRPRRGWRRALFLLARCCVLLAAIRFVPVLLPVLLVFYLLAHAMPYDLLPGQPEGAKGDAPASEDAPARKGARVVGPSGEDDLADLDEPFGLADSLPDPAADDHVDLAARSLPDDEDDEG